MIIYLHQVDSSMDFNPFYHHLERGPCIIIRVCLYTYVERTCTTSAHLDGARGRNANKVSYFNEVRKEGRGRKECNFGREEIRQREARVPNHLL